MAKPRKKKQKTAEIEARPAGNWLTRLIFRPRFLFLLAAGVSSTVLVPLLKNSLPDLRDRKEYRLSGDDIVITEPPRGVPPDLVQQVLDRSGLPDDLSLLDDELTEEIAAAFQRHPWIEEVVRVKKSIPARLEVDVKYRRPAAMIQVQGGLYPVDAAGVLLPPEDFSVADSRRFPLVQGVSSTPQGPAGTEWGDVVVVASARLAAALKPHWKKLQLKSISAPRRTNADVKLADLSFQLTTKGGSTIIWGRAPGTAYPGELSAKQKIGRLQNYLKDFGGFDEPHGPYEIDIRHWQEISRRPLAVNNGRTTRR